MKRIWLSAVVSVVGICASSLPVLGQEHAPLHYHGGPILKRFRIYPLYYGHWSSADITAQQNYLTGLTAYISGKDEPPGKQPMMWQYGVYEASVNEAKTMTAPPCASTCDLSRPQLVDIIRDSQASGKASEKLPAFGPAILIMVFLSHGYTSHFCGPDACHNSESASSFWAVVPQDSGPTLPLVTAHEVFEASIDPADNNDVGWDEAVDGCTSTVTLPFGEIPGAADNTHEGDCSTNGYIRANSYFLLSVSADKVIDVQGAKTTKGTPLDIWPEHSPATDGQLWTFEPGQGSHPGYFFIKSNLGHNLVIDVQGEGKTEQGAKLQSNPQKSPSTNSQLWKLEPILSLLPVEGVIRSRLGESLVIDVQGDKTTKGTLLDIWPQGSGKFNQLWFIIPEPGNSYHPNITAIVPNTGGYGFAVTGTGFQPGTQVLANYQFDDLNTGNHDIGSLLAVTDLGGGFVSDNPAAGLKLGSPGLLTLQVFISFPPLPAGGIVSASWDGTKFSVTGAPFVITNPASGIASSSATLNGSVDPHGLPTSIYFQYGRTIAYGHTTPTQSQTDNTYHNLSANISGLTAGTTYHFRMVATNNAGNCMAATSTFTTP
jgi:hypothetical protein